MAWADRTFSDLMSYRNAYKIFKNLVKAGLFSPDSEVARWWCKSNFIQYQKGLKKLNILSKRLTCDLLV